MNRWLKIGFFVMLSSLLCGASLKEALNELREHPYGFVMCDVGITPWDLQLFSSIDIQREWVYHQFGELATIEQSIANFIDAIGFNREGLPLQVAFRLKEITEAVIEASGKTTGWVCLRSFIPINRYDVPRWHVDGPYYPLDGSDELLFKFVLTLEGPTTLFYPLSLELRKMTEKVVHNRQYMKTVCKQANIVSPKLGEGAVFKGGRYTACTALHSEPPIHENRLFLSIVPCTETQLPILKARVAAVYPKVSQE